MLRVLRQIRDVLRVKMYPICFFLPSSDPDIQSYLLGINDAIMLPGVVSTKGTDLVQSLLKLYQPLPTPEFIPADFGEASGLINWL